MRLRDISRCLAALCLILSWSARGASTEPVRVLVSFSILADIARRVGGGDVAVTSLIGHDANEHVFEPSPDQVRLLSRSQLFIVQLDAASA